MATTLVNLIYQARLETGTLNSNYFDDAVEMPLYANDAVSAVYDRLVAAYAPYFAKTSADFTLTATTGNSISLAEICDPDHGEDPAVSDFYKELGLNCQVNRGQNFIINGPNLEIFPNLESAYAGTYQLVYVPNAPTLTDVIDLPAELERWKKLIILEMTLVMKTKRQQDTGMIERKILEQNKRIDNMTQHRQKESKRMPMRDGVTGWLYSYNPGYEGP